MSSPSTSIDSLMEQCILALEADDAARVEALIAEHPDQAPELRARLDNLRALGILDAPKSSFAIPEQLGEFRLLRQIGRGGMGIVYLAEQSALQRQVALKLVHPEHLFFRGARDRFRREVLAVARLHHPGIVPILTCGETSGIPYYAMELVSGASLAEVLDELVGTAPASLDGPTLRGALQRALAKKHELAAVVDAAVFRGAWTNVCANLVLQVAEALQHAHAQGVLHRDLKPSNLLLTNTGQVRLIDFGLASAEGEQRITRSGATLGSLPYMAPEQVRGDVQHLDERTDVYQLGVTFYELLTTTLPHGDGRGDTREHILAGLVEPPARRNMQVHPDAEAVCLMAMDADPARRYASAAALVADLTAFLDQRTVRARKPSPWLRLRRSARRRPAAAATAIAAFLVLVPGPLLFALQQSAANTRIQKALEDGDAQRQLAEQNLGYALDAVETMLLRTAEARLADVPRTAHLRRQLLQDAVDFHNRLAAAATTEADNPQVRASRAHSQSLLGSLHTDLGDLDTALPLLLQAQATFEQLLPDAKDKDHLRYELARCDERLAVVQGRTGHLVEYEAAQLHAVELFRELGRHQPTTRNLEAAINAGIAHATALGRLRRWDEAAHELDELDRTLAPSDGPPQPQLTTTSRVLLWSSVANTRGILLARNGEIDGAGTAFAEALRRIDSLPAADAEDREVRAQRVGVLERIGLADSQRRLWDEAAPFLDRACTEYEALAKLEPELPVWRSQLARMLGSRASNRRQRGEVTAAGADHDRAVDLLTNVVAEAPDDADYQRALALAHAERADWRRSTNDSKGAMADFEQAEAITGKALEALPDDGQLLANLGAELANHATLLAIGHDYPAALKLLERALALTSRWHSPEGERSRIELLGLVADMRLRTDDAPGASAAWNEANERADHALQARPEDRSLLRTVAVMAVNQSILSLDTQGPEPTLAILDRWLPTMRKAATTAGVRPPLARGLLLHADANLRLDRKDAARASFQEAIGTGITRDDVLPYDGLPELFDRPEFHDLLPHGSDGK